MTRNGRRVILLAALACVMAGCGDDDSGRRDAGPGFDSGPVVPPASASPQVAFEGHSRMAVDLTAPDADFAGGTVEVEDPSGPVEVLEQRCNRARCGVVLRIADTRPNMGKPVPAPIDGENHFLRIRSPMGEWRALLSVRPLDEISNRSTAMPLMVGGIVLASSVSAMPGSTFRGQADEEPVRWISFGGGGLNGTVDVSGEGAVGYAGGAAGGAAGAMGAGAGGAPGTAGAGGGGGGGGEAGEPGQGADGTAGGGGAGAAARHEASASCASDFTEAADCGGSGGGGAAGAGGGGGGSLMLVSLEPLDLSGASLLALGGNGGDGGGGGGGGNIVVAVPSWTAPNAITVSGGMGGTAAGAGGAGGMGRARVDMPSGDTLGAWNGPAVDLSGLSQVTSNAMLTVTGRAEANATVELRDVLTPSATFAGTADATGAFVVEVTLQPGINRLSVLSSGDAGSARSWTGTNIEFQMRPGVIFPVPVGATVDVVLVPDSE